MKKRTIITARSIGFCFGVTKAVELAKKILDKHKCLVSLGDLVHNDLVMTELKEKGMRVVTSISEIKGCPFIIRSHGLPPDILEKVKKQTSIIYDATCPFVKKVQNLIRVLSADKNFIFLVGDSAHPEIKAMKKIAGKNCTIVNPQSNTDFSYIKAARWAIIGQTTLSLNLYRTAITRILKRIPAEKITIFNTICPVSIERQSEALKLAGNVDLLIVVGGRKSSNTEKLVLTGKKINKNTILVETPEEVKKLSFANFQKIGIISGASTDVSCIKEILRILRNHPAQKNHRG
ncbi:MAG TPA: 4-hydroxy-3-methylbut-2-enyl diphosphate reductase [Candidatus Ratteibacteria bacterium]|jgi:4-hydroxy-3-methylbut-2-enyl diphosphate reductase|uniref:4-hydroxy-3-methylbut-2-enyl diphosphate reductase n=1 Tax=candidate division TA06 bacterium ADurb.Bin131 TaxID=1852827 RepID=A0A1V6C9E9_UNCT6|nr:MAG: 4-hydroxy-3-methylbut-2-enyl diphosphate reductase [candidate division TA06 bacterium ADurb.Bin131]HON05964.1 4-hydroxy-3-methylbut-2-enyl diphosphate reductase [bacterium]HRS05433.1 4-hydroxy-3-methylbut-2-enyl diphosphate reductase [Candidatus Ratteibacteria bacterium]HOQ82156.1 4-hydroxy-3-methylbut-2-enyl diphosphate reductase [bacterium]HPC28805.1 4-hydroxy-3-methylbut-2-enyl diphosphate reductase [bacterium]